MEAYDIHTRFHVTVCHGLTDCVTESPQYDIAIFLDKLLCSQITRDKHLKVELNLLLWEAKLLSS